MDPIGPELGLLRGEDPRTADPPEAAEDAGRPVQPAIAPRASAPSGIESFSAATASAPTAHVASPAPTGYTASPAAPTAHTASPVPTAEEEVSAAARVRDTAPEISSVHPVRARLLAKAEDARRSRSAEEQPATLVSRPGHALPAGPATSRRRTELSPSALAIFGTLLGLATVASLTALAVSFSRGTDDPAPQAPVASPSALPATETKAPRQKVAGPWRVADAKGDPGLEVIEGTIGRKAFLTAVKDAGLEKSQAYRVLTILKGLRDLERCAPTDRFMAAVDRSSRRVKAFEYIVRAEEVYQAREGPDGLLDAKSLDLKVVRGQVSGVILADGSFRDSAVKGGFEPTLADIVRTALDGHMRLEDFQAGDVVRVIAQEVTVLGEFARYAGVEALDYRPKDGSEPFRLYYVETPRMKGHYDKQGRAPYEGGWRVPVQGAVVTSKFNMRRVHPILKKAMPHTGTDFGLPGGTPVGTPVGASSYGTVSYIGYAGPSGNLVKVQHSGNVETGYAHLSRFAEGLKVGDKVKRLELVGYVGSTGRSTGPHLHFTVKRNGEFIDPESLKLNALRVLPAADRPAFDVIQAQYDQLLDAIELPKVVFAEAQPALPSAAGPEGAARVPGANEADLFENDDPLHGESAAVHADGAKPSSAPSPVVGAAPQVLLAPPLSAPAEAAAAVTGTRPLLYLTDEELLKIQSRTDDGEVKE